VRQTGGATGLPPYAGPRWLTPSTVEAAPLIVVITAPDQESRHWHKLAGTVPGVAALPFAGALSALTQPQGWHFG
jgi:hypothetical protein